MNLPNRTKFPIIMSLLLVVMSAFVTESQLPSTHTSIASAAETQTAVTTFHNDTLRTGQNLNETRLNTNNVNPGLFGKKTSYRVDGQIYTQPLVLPNVAINGNTYTVIYVATENDSVYAFDANQTGTTKPLWHTSFIHRPQITPARSIELYAKYPNKDIYPQVGITGTPVIDIKTGILYVVAMTKEQGNFVQRLHALDITSGKDMPGSPLVIKASVPGTGYDSVNGIVSFNAQTANQRPALLLLNGIVYIAWAAFGDTDPYHGWILGYAYNGIGLYQVTGAVYNDTAAGQEGGIWMGGSGLTADASGEIYFTTGNGSSDLGNGGIDASDSFVKLNARHGLHQIDYFTPFNETCLDGRDGDLGSGGVVLIPYQTGSRHPYLLVGTGKEGRIYLLNRESMGKFTSDPHLNCASPESFRTDIDKVLQELPPTSTGGGIFGVGGYWSGTAHSGQMVYFGGFSDHLRAFQLKNDRLSSTPSAQTSEVFGFSGATPSISSNGHRNHTGIVWVIGPSTCNFPGCVPQGPAALRAYAADDISKELYSSSSNASRDQVQSYVKFSVPTVANGQVYVGTQNSLDIFGLLK